MEREETELVTPKHLGSREIAGPPVELGETVLYRDESEVDTVAIIVAVIEDSEDEHCNLVLFPALPNSDGRYEVQFLAAIPHSESHLPKSWRWPARRLETPRFGPWTGSHV